MGADHSKPPTELREYLTLLRQRDGAGRPFIIVGGHAANFWAELYSEREPRLKGLLPFVSKDLDLIGTEAEAARVAQAIGWHLLPPPVHGGPVQAVVSSQPDGGGLTVEFLSQIKGVSYETIAANAREGLVRVPALNEDVSIRVLDPVLVLAGKIRNAVDIEQDQPDKPRQDVKHVEMLALCVPHFLDDVRVQTTDREQQRRACGKYIATLAALQRTYSGRQFEGRYPGVIRWHELIPPRIKQMLFEQDTQVLLRQLTANDPSRGTGR